MRLKNLIIAIGLFGISFLVLYFSISFFANYQYQSEMVIYPPNTHINDHLLEAGLSFGGEKEINEYIEILNSLDVRDSIVNKYNLAQHYGIETNTQAIGQFNKNIEISRSMNKSIHIKVKDKDPKIAVALTLSLVEIADNHKSQLLKSNIKRPYFEAKATYENKKSEMAIIEQRLKDMKAEGQYFIQNGVENSSSAYALESMKYQTEFEWFKEFKNNYEKLRTNYEQDAPRSYIISRPSADAVTKLPDTFKTAALFSFLLVLIYLAVVVLKDKIRLV